VLPRRRRRGARRARRRARDPSRLRAPPRRGQAPARPPIRSPPARRRAHAGQCETACRELQEKALALGERRRVAQDLERAGQLTVELDRRAECELEPRGRRLLADFHARAREFGGERGRRRVDCVSGQSSSVRFGKPHDRRLGGADLHRDPCEFFEGVAGRAEIRRVERVYKRPEGPARDGPAVCKLVWTGQDHRRNREQVSLPH
jgi:hypothetical protein